jgi:exodeoxyribonuclease III
MGVSNCLSGRLANIDADVEAVRHATGGNVVGHGDHQAPDCSLFLGRQGQEIGLVPPWNDQAVAWTDREGVSKGDGQAVLSHQGAGGQAAAEGTRHWSEVTTPAREARGRQRLRGSKGEALVGTLGDRVDSTAVRLLTWNLNARRRLEGQLAAIVAHSPDIVALQELTRRSSGFWRVALRDAGLAHVIDSFSASAAWAAVGPRKYGLIVASRFPLTPLASVHVVPWPERILSVAVSTTNGAVTVHTTHIPPGSSNGWMKVEMLEAVSAVVSESADTPCLLCGDFNAPQAETSQGDIVTWAQQLVVGRAPRARVRFRGGEASRWDAAERTVMQGGTHGSLVDAFRHLHGYGREEFSWFVRRGQLRVGRRFDHIFCSRDVQINRCEYVHSVREKGLSDHAAMWLDFDM